MADIATLTVRLTAALSQFEQQMGGAASKIDQVTKEAEAASKAFQKMSAGFSGDRILQEATTVAAAIDKIGGATKLTEAEQAKANRTITEAIAKYTALGQAVPPQIAKLAGEFKALEEGQRKAAGETEAMGVSFLKLTGASAVGNLLADAVRSLGSAIAASVTDTIAFADHLADLEAKTGITTTGLQELAFATEQSGVSLDSVTQATTKLGAALVAGDKGVVRGLEKVGLSVAELRQLAPDELFIKAADAIGKIADPAEKARRAVEIFGKQGLELLPALTGEMAQTVAQARQLGIVISTETIAAAAKLADQFDILKLQGRAFIAEALAPMLPLLNDLITTTTELAGTFINELGRAFTDRDLVLAARDLKAAIAEAVGVEQQELARELARAFVELAAIAVRAAGFVVQSWAGVASTMEFVAIAIARAMEMSNRGIALEAKSETQREAAAAAAAEWKALADELVIAQQAHHEMALGMGPVIEGLNDMAAALSATAGPARELSREVQDALFEFKDFPELGVVAGVTMADLERNTKKARKAIGEFGDETDEALKKATTAFEAFQKALDAATGRGARQKANELLQVLEAIERQGLSIDPSKLREFQQVLQTAIDNARRLGEEVSPEWIKWNNQIILSAQNLTATLMPALQASGEAVRGFIVGIQQLPWDALFGGRAAPNIAAPVQEELDRAARLVRLEAFEHLGREIGETIGRGLIDALEGASAADVGRTIGAGLGQTLGQQIGKVLSTQIAEGIGGAVGKTVGGIVGSFAGPLVSLFLSGFGQALGEFLQGTAKQAGEFRQQILLAGGGLETMRDAAEGNTAALQALDSLLQANQIGSAKAAAVAYADAMAEAERQTHKLGAALDTLTARGALLTPELRDELTKIGTSLQPQQVAVAFKFFQEQTDNAAKGLQAFVSSSGNALAHLRTVLDQGGKSTKAAVETLGLSFDKLKDLTPEQAFDKLQAALAGIADPAERARLSMELFGRTALKSQAGATAATAAIGAIFADLQRQGASAGQALQALQPSIAALTQQLAVTGFTGSAAFGQLSTMAAFASDAVSGPLFEAIGGLGDLLVGLSNTGALTQEMFTGLAGEVTNTWNELVSMGKGGAAGLALIQKPLQRVWELTKDHGYAVDEATQKLLDEGEAAGIVGDQFRDSGDKQVRAIQELVDRIGQLIDVLTKDMVAGAETGAKGVQTALDNIKTPTIEIPVTFNIDDFPELPTFSADVQGSALSVNASVVVDGEVLARSTARHIPRVMAPYGIGA